MSSWTIARLLETAATYLRDKGSSSPRLDAELLLAEALGLERVQLYVQYDRPLSTDEVADYRRLVARRARHEPVAHILGRSHFRHLTLEVGPAVLIPRPETEELVDVALETLRLRPPWRALESTVDPAECVAAGTSGDADAQRRRRPFIADVGTGSGAIALSMAREAGLGVLATDISADALALAARNRTAAGMDDLVELCQADLLAGVPDHSLHLVVSNPPYVTSEEMLGLAPDVRLFEPPGALAAGPEGLDVYRRLLPEAARTLEPGGSVVLEVGHTQAAAVMALARDAGFALVTTHKDLSGKERIVRATLPGASVRSLSDLDDTGVAALGRALEAGAIIGLPTDTVYGLAARWDSAAGVRRLFAAKGRGDARPVAAVFPSVEVLVCSIPDLDPRAEAVLRALLPGPYTFVVATQVPRPPLVGTPESLGVRVPDHLSLLDFLNRLGTGVAATSANLSGQADAVTLAGTDPRLLAHCCLALTEPPGWGETPPAGRPSTVVDLRPLSVGESPVVLREGAVGAAQVQARIAALGV